MTVANLGALHPQARRYANLHHPRDPKTGLLYPLCGASTGRFCFGKGPCSLFCLDPFGEGADSALNRLGPGVPVSSPLCPKRSKARAYIYIRFAESNLCLRS